MAHLLFLIQPWSSILFSFIKPSYKVLEGEVSVIATRQSSSDVKWRCYLESEGTESEVNKNSTVIKWQGSWKENAREEERESIPFLGWILALYLGCSPSWNLTKHSGNMLSNKFKPPFPSSLHLCHSCYSVCENATKDPVTWWTWGSGTRSEFDGVGAIPTDDRKIQSKEESWRSKDTIDRRLYNRISTIERYHRKTNPDDRKIQSKEDHIIERYDWPGSREKERSSPLANLI